MFTFAKWLRVFSGSSILRKSLTFRCISSNNCRTFADTPKTDATTNQNTGTENETRMRVRRARPSDVPRVLRFVREHARMNWPGLADPPAAPHLILCDYLSRALAQGHSMLAEQQETRRGWTRIRGLALGTAVCPWDANLIEKWARCMRCIRSKRMMQFQAHCLRAPELHDKYKVHNILQVILIIPPEHTKTEIVEILAKSAIQRGKDVGFQLVRFDVTSEKIAKILEENQLKKEWQIVYDVLPDTKVDRNIDQENIAKSDSSSSNIAPEQAANVNENKQVASEKGYFAVYTAEPKYL